MDERLASFNVGDTYQIVDLIGQYLELDLDLTRGAEQRA